MLIEGETHIWAFDLDVSDAIVARLEQTLSSDEIARAERFKFARDRSRFVAARGQLRAILSRYTGVDAGKLQFTYSAFGKPALLGVRNAQEIRFNTSGSDSMGILALRVKDEIGIDIERIRAFRDALSVAQRMFTADEHIALLETREDARTLRFFQHWTRKEAIVKALDTGIFQPMDFIGALPHPGDETQRIEIERGGSRAMHWVRTLPPPREEFIAAIASLAPFGIVRTWRSSGRESS